jgi:flagellar biosynthesis protein FlhB
MAEDKPFDPTPGRLARAKREGDLPRSRDVTAAASFACAAGALAGVHGQFANAAGESLREAARGGSSLPPFALLAGCCAGVLVCASAGSVAASLAQGGVALRLPAPSLKRLDPVAGLRRLAGRDAALGALKALLTAAAVAGAVLPAAREAFGANGASAGAPALAALVAGALVSAFASATLVAAAFAGLDVLAERAKWRRRLRMSFEEVKRDHKQSEGDPLVRGRRRQAHRDLMRGSISRLQEAAFVIANPRHVAIALAYAPPAIAVPHVLIRAIDAGAREVKARARGLGIPIVENVALARALLAKTRVGEPIPRDEYGAVAIVVAALARAGALAP